MEIQSFSYEQKELYQLSMLIRTMVFQVEQGVDPAIEREHEEEARYFLVFDNDEAVATARWRNTPLGIKLERFAVLKEYRNKGVGSVLLDRVLAEVIPLHKTIYLHAQETAVNFYLKNGFSVEGKPFSEADIIHYKMVL